MGKITHTHTPATHWLVSRTNPHTLSLFISPIQSSLTPLLLSSRHFLFSASPPSYSHPPPPPPSRPRCFLNIHQGVICIAASRKRLSTQRWQPSSSGKCVCVCEWVGAWHVFEKGKIQPDVVAAGQEEELNRAEMMEDLMVLIRRERCYHFAFSYFPDLISLRPLPSRIHVSAVCLLSTWTVAANCSLSLAAYWN